MYRFRRCREARKKLEQVMQTARKLGSQELVNEIFRSRVGKYFSYVAKTQSIELSPIKTDGFILDVGGGGEGIIGKLNGKQVVAIDTSEQELRETSARAIFMLLHALFWSGNFNLFQNIVILILSLIMVGCGLGILWMYWVFRRAPKNA
jgi:hypothetical protein